MSEVLEIVRFTVHAGQREEFLAGRAAAIDAIGAAFPGLLDPRLAEHDDGSWSDVVRWRTREQADRAAAECTRLPAMRAWVAHIAEVREMTHAVVRHPESA